MLCLPLGLSPCAREFCTIVHRFAQKFEQNLIDAEKVNDYLALRLNREA
jgi:hypothetical protein